MTTDEKFTIPVSTPDDVLATVPALLGFHPVDSVVLIGFQGMPRRAGATSRIGLRDYMTNRASVIKSLAEIYIRNGIEDVIVVFYGRTPDFDIEQALAEHGIAVIDILASSNEPHPVLPALEAANAMSGRTVLPNREALVRSVAYRAGGQADNLDALLAVMGDVHERDRFITVALKQRKQVLPLLITACQATGNDVKEVICNLLATTAVAAYRAGDGALALEALERSERIDRDHVLSALLMAMVTAGVPPEVLDGFMLGADQEATARSAGHQLLEKWAVAAGVPL